MNQSKTNFEGTKASDSQRTDAERYRWLRDNRLSGRNGELFSQAMGWKPYQMCPNEVDAAIDAARGAP